MSAVAPARSSDVGHEAGLAAIRREYAADLPLATRILEHIRTEPRRARIRAEAQQLVDAERWRRRELRSVARAFGIDESDVGPDELARYWRAKADEHAAAGRTYAAAQLRERANASPEGWWAGDLDVIENAVAVAEELTVRATHERKFALALAAHIVRTTHGHLIGEVQPLPEVRAELEQLEAQEQGHTWRRQLEAGIDRDRLDPPASERAEEALDQVLEEHAWARQRGGAIRR